MAVAIAWLPGPAGTRRRVAKPSVEEPDAAEPARPDLWGARVSNDPGLPDLVEAALAHRVQNPVEAAYARSDLFERRRRLMDEWAAYLTGERRPEESSPR